VAFNRTVHRLVLQKEIAYFRQSRGEVDVVQGEVLPGYVQSVREDIGKVDISFREFGGKAKAEGVGRLIMDQLDLAENDGGLPIGDKSSPKDINEYFPGVSKTALKKAVGALYRQGLIKPGPKFISKS
jgi:predicted RNA-binding protein (virulence factor B family)